MPSRHKREGKAEPAPRDRTTQGTDSDQTYFDVVRSMSQDPVIRTAVDKAEEREAPAKQD